MGRTIQVYVKSEENVATEKGLVPSVSGHPCAGIEPVIEYKKKHVLPETYKQVVDIAKKVAEEKGIKLEVYDQSSSVGKLRALFKGVNETPTVIIGNQRIIGSVTEKKLLSLLE